MCDQAHQRWAALSFGVCHGAAVTASGQLFTWGNNAAGQLGQKPPQPLPSGPHQPSPPQALRPGPSEPGPDLAPAQDSGIPVSNAGRHSQLGLSRLDRPQPLAVLRNHQIRALACGAAVSTGVLAWPRATMQIMMTADTPTGQAAQCALSHSGGSAAPLLCHIHRHPCAALLVPVYGCYLQQL